MEDKILDRLEIVAFDTETTGLAKGSRIVEIGGLRFQGRQSISEFPSTLINPEIKIPPQASAVHKITDEMVQNQPKGDEVLRRFFDFARNALLVAHNLPYDLGILEGEIQRLKLEVPSFYGIDTLQLARQWVPNLPSYRLAQVAEHLGISYSTLHRAHEDAKLVKEILLSLLDRARRKLGKEPTLREFAGPTGITLFTTNS